MSGRTRTWEEQGGIARAGMAAFGFLAGEWEGQGQDHGEPIQARATGTLWLDGTWLELHEILRDAAGQVVHEDRALYRFDPVEDHPRVIHFLAHAFFREYPLKVEDGVVQWCTGPFGPVVTLAPTAGGWRSAVRMPDEPEATITLDYVRVPDGR